PCVTPDVVLLSGDGGNSVKGTGGKGGNLASVSVTSGSIFVSGNGGRGAIGGDGGAIIGNPFGLDTTVTTPPTAPSAAKSDLENAETGALVLFSGNGGRSAEHT